MTGDVIGYPLNESQVEFRAELKLANVRGFDTSSFGTVARSGKHCRSSGRSSGLATRQLQSAIKQPVGGVVAISTISRGHLT
jgi:hypothetical protein